MLALEGVGPGDRPARAHARRPSRLDAGGGDHGRQVVSGSEDKTLKVEGLETGALICTFTCKGRVDCAAAAPHGRTFVAGDAGGRVYFLRLEKG